MKPLSSGLYGLKEELKRVNLGIEEIEKKKKLERMLKKRKEKLEKDIKELEKELAEEGRKGIGGSYRRIE